MKKYVLSACIVFVSMISLGQGLYPLNKKDKWGYKNYSGKVIIKPQYENAMEFEDQVDLAAVVLNGKWGFIDKKNNMVIPNIYDKVFYRDSNKKYFFQNGKASVELNGNKIFIDTTGKQILGAIGDFGNDDYAICYAERDPYGNGGKGKQGLVNKSKEIVVPTEYTYLVYSCADCPLSAQKEADGKYGFINVQNEVVIPFQYESVTGFVYPDDTWTQPVSRVKLDGKWFYMSTKGEFLGEVSEETLRAIQEKYERERVDVQAAIEEFQRLNEERLNPQENSGSSSSSSSSSKVTKVHHCGFCASTVVSEKDPSDRNCSNSMNTAKTHKWKTLGVSGNTSYYCKQCNLTIQTEDKTPVYMDNCSGKRTSLGNPGGHSWKKL